MEIADDLRDDLIVVVAHHALPILRRRLAEPHPLLASKDSFAAGRLELKAEAVNFPFVVEDQQVKLPFQIPDPVTHCPLLARILKLPKARCHECVWTQGPHKVHNLVV